MKLFKEEAKNKDYLLLVLLSIILLLASCTEPVEDVDGGDTKPPITLPPAPVVPTTPPPVPVSPPNPVPIDVTVDDDGGITVTTDDPNIIITTTPGPTTTDIWDEQGRKVVTFDDGSGGFRFTMCTDGYWDLLESWTIYEFVSTTCIEPWYVAYLSPQFTASMRRGHEDHTPMWEEGYWR
jgi:hypothetical protein